MGANQPSIVKANELAFRQALTVSPTITGAEELANYPLDLAFCAAAIGMALVDMQGRWVRVNSALCDLLGRTESELIGTTYQAISHPDDTELATKYLASCVTAGSGTASIEKRYLRPDGQVVWVHLTSTLLRDKVGRPLGFFSQTIDVSERKKLEFIRASKRSRLEALLATTSDGVGILDQHGRVIYHNLALSSLLSREIYGELSTVQQCIHPGDVESFDRLWEKVQSSDGGVGTIEVRTKCLDGCKEGCPQGNGRYLQLTLTDQSQHPAVEGVVLTAHDVTESRHYEKGLADAADRMRAIVEASPASIVEFDRNGRVCLWNAAAEAMYGWTRDEVLGRLPSSVEEQDRPAFNDTLSKVLQGARLGPLTATRRCKDGKQIDLTVSWAPILGPDGKVDTAISLALDVTERNRLEEQLQNRAFYDPLTGLANRSLLVDRLTHAMTRSRSKIHPLSILFIDLDGFKRINDSSGHAAGDVVLKEVSGRIAAAVRASDTVGRLGGDEFAVLLEGLDTQAAVEVAARVQRALCNPFVTAIGEVVIGASIGISSCDGTRRVAEDLIRDADTAMYVGKASGKGQIQVFHGAMREALVGRIAIEHDLRSALDRDEMRVHFQPIIDLRSRSVEGYEALLRWEHPNRGLLMPDQFIDVAESTGWIRPLGLWVLHKACTALASSALQKLEPNLSIHVNLSSVQLGDDDLATKVASILKETRLSPAQLTIELTESILVADMERGMRRLKELKEVGVYLAIDDFGTGYSSLSYLEHLPVDCLKLDRSFVSQLPTAGSKRRGLVSAMIQMAELLGMKIVAEGIETEGELEVLLELGCTFGQGFLIGRPAAITES